MEKEISIIGVIFGTAMYFLFGFTWTLVTALFLALILLSYEKRLALFTFLSIMILPAIITIGCIIKL